MPPAFSVRHEVDFRGDEAHFTISLWALFFVVLRNEVTSPPFEVCVATWVPTALHYYPPTSLRTPSLNSARPVKLKVRNAELPGDGLGSESLRFFFSPSPASLIVALSFFGVRDACDDRPPSSAGEGMLIPFLAPNGKG